MWITLLSFNIFIVKHLTKFKMKELNRFRQFLAEGKMNEGFELNGREVVDLEGEAEGEDSYITSAYYMDTGEKLTDDEIDSLVNKYPAQLEPGGMWWHQQR